MCRWGGAGGVGRPLPWREPNRRWIKKGKKGFGVSVRARAAQRGQAARGNPPTASGYRRRPRCPRVRGAVYLGLEALLVKGDAAEAVRLFYVYEGAFFIVSHFRIDSITCICMRKRLILKAAQ